VNHPCDAALRTPHLIAVSKITVVSANFRFASAKFATIVNDLPERTNKSLLAIAAKPCVFVVVFHFVSFQCFQSFPLAAMPELGVSLGKVSTLVPNLAV
jgi:hypothetical protein